MQCHSESRVCYSRRPSRPRTCPVRVALIQCSFGLSPEFSTPVEKTVEIPGETPSKAARLALRNEPLGRNPRPHRNEGQPALVLYLVSADDVYRRRPRLGDRAGAERALQGLAHETLLGRHYGSDERTETSEPRDQLRRRRAG